MYNAQVSTFLATRLRTRPRQKDLQRWRNEQAIKWLACRIMSFGILTQRRRRATWDQEQPGLAPSHRGSRASIGKGFSSIHVFHVSVFGIRSRLDGETLCPIGVFRVGKGRFALLTPTSFW